MEEQVRTRRIGEEEVMIEEISIEQVVITARAGDNFQPIPFENLFCRWSVQANASILLVDGVYTQKEKRDVTYTLKVMR